MSTTPALAQADAAQGVLVARHVGLLLVPGLPQLLDRPLVYQPIGRPRGDAAAVVGWGLKGRFRQAAAWAERHGLPYLALEDGFLRSVSLGDSSAPLSLCVDDLGIYYDARRPSRLEQAIARAHTALQLERARALAASWRDGRLSKYNHARERRLPLSDPFLLVVDQTAGDASIELGLADASSFARMLEAALDEHPALPVLLKVHPDVIAGRKRAHFSALPAGAASRVTLLAGDAHPPALLQAAHTVYVVTSQMGFEALMWGKPVRAFGMPFYAGWRLTRDELAPPERRSTPHRVSLEDLVHAALVEYPRYVDPETRARCEAERLLAWMTLQRRQRERFAPQVQAVAFSRWKQPIARSFFAGSTLRFTERPQPLTATELARAVWGRADDDRGGAGNAPTAAAPTLRVEDGFLRSVGLGADWVWPVSWVIDRSGIYYDATAPCDLETLLQNHEFDETLLARAAALQAAVVAGGVTKYNVGQGTWQRPPGTQRVVLVPGQVESDRSIEFGALGPVRSNLGLLQAVRAKRPDAYILYKPHPDVVSGKRGGRVVTDAVRLACDEVVVDVPMHHLLDAVDEVQVLTSLAGFEALLRRKPVVCHGAPFYAGWGLTEDHQPLMRRTRELTLEQLVAGALILYPTYLSRTTGAFTTPERALHELTHWQATAPRVDPGAIRALRALKRWRDRLRRR